MNTLMEIPGVSLDGSDCRVLYTVCSVVLQVMSRGGVKEFDRPSQLLTQPHSLFRHNGGQDRRGHIYQTPSDCQRH